MYIAVIGAGGSGLCAARYILEQDMGCVVFEQNESVGGTWVYTDYVGKDKHGLPVSSSVYKTLRTNLPKEAMEFPGFHFQESEESYVSRDVVLDYLNEYANKYNLKSHIKLNHHIKHVSPVGNKWKVTVVNLIKNEELTCKFDAVMVCTGHNCSAVYPTIEGLESFTGSQLHSHDYKMPDQFDNKRILVIGGGPSGIDIAYELSFVAEKIIWSYHSDKIDKTLFPDILHKADVKKINKAKVEFIDGTSIDDVEVIIHCTGYKYDYPFLDDSCGISVEGNYVSPLYKYIININYPTMGFIGIPKLAPQFPMFDLQVRYFLKLLSTKLPDKNIMTKYLEEFEAANRASNTPVKKYQLLGTEFQQDYFNDLANEADVLPIPVVFHKLHEHAIKEIFTDFTNFRKNVYRVKNESEFKFYQLEIN